MSPPQEFVLALDIGGTRFRTALVDRHQKIVKRTTGETRPEEGPTRGLDRIVRQAKALASPDEWERVLAVGIAIASPVHTKGGVLCAPPNLPGWDQLPLRDLIQERLNRPAFFDNDANLAAMGEHLLGAGKGVDHFIYITISTGIGGGIITNGRLLQGSQGLAGELGHLTVNRHGHLDRCGNLGCVEAHASGTSIARIAQLRMQAGERSPLLQASDNLTAEEVFLAAAQGDALAQSVVETAAEDLGAALVSLLHLFNPQLIVIGGGVGVNQWQSLSPHVEQYLSRHAMAQFRAGVRFTMSALGDDAGLQGAGLLAWEGVRQEKRSRSNRRRRG